MGLTRDALKAIVRNLEYRLYQRSYQKERDTNQYLAISRLGIFGHGADFWTLYKQFSMLIMAEEAKYSGAPIA